jgi:acrylyl-CoA reductase (NADPH)
MSERFRALYVSQRETGFVKEVKELDLSELPQNDVLIRVHYSSLNYKDALSASGNRGVTKKFPHVPGIDAAGIVEKSASAAFPEGTPVIVTGGVGLGRILQFRLPGFYHCRKG